ELKVIDQLANDLILLGSTVALRLLAEKQEQVDQRRGFLGIRARLPHAGFWGLAERHHGRLREHHEQADEITIRGGWRGSGRRGGLAPVVKRLRSAFLRRLDLEDLR